MASEERLEELAYSLGRRFAEERDRLRESAAAMIADIEMHKTAALLEIERRLALVKDGEPGLRGDKGEKGDPGVGEPGLPGEKGSPGDRGEKGEKGERGEEGGRGEQGIQGEKGDRGDAGEKGEKGDEGQRGEQGEQGQQGEKGEKGDPGERGERGERGTFTAPAAWQDGVHYQSDLVFCDGSTWCALRDTAARPPHDDWAPVALAGRDGADGVSGEARGLYDPNAAYGRMDRVSFNGSEWIARRDNPGKLPGDGWMLGVQGKTGKPGPKGDRGEPGIGVFDVSVDDYAFVMKLSNGKTIRFDLRAMFERYDEERGG